MRDKIIKLIENKKGRYKAEELADEILALHNAELEKFANQLGISTAPADYFRKRQPAGEPEDTQ